MGVEGSKEALAQLSNDFSKMLVLDDNSTLRQVYNDECLGHCRRLERIRGSRTGMDAQYECRRRRTWWRCNGRWRTDCRQSGERYQKLTDRANGSIVRPMQTDAEDVLPSLNQQPIQVAENQTEKVL